MRPISPKKWASKTKQFRKKVDFAIDYDQIIRNSDLPFSPNEGLKAKKNSTGDIVHSG